MAENQPERRLGLGALEKIKIAGGLAVAGAGVAINALGYSEHNPYVENAGSIAIAAGTILAIRQFRPISPEVEAS